MATHRIQAAEASVRSVLREQRETRARKSVTPESKPAAAGPSDCDAPDDHVVVARMDEAQLSASRIRDVDATDQAFGLGSTAYCRKQNGPPLRLVPPRAAAVASDQLAVECGNRLSGSPPCYASAKSYPVYRLRFQLRSSTALRR